MAAWWSRIASCSWYKWLLFFHARFLSSLRGVLNHGLLHIQENICWCSMVNFCQLSATCWRHFSTASLTRSMPILLSRFSLCEYYSITNCTNINLGSNISTSSRSFLLLALCVNSQGPLRLKKKRYNFIFLPFQEQLFGIVHNNCDPRTSTLLMLWKLSPSRVSATGVE